MRVLQLPYEIVPGHSHLLPICEVRLLGPRSVSLRALVDSGAVFSVFPVKAAEDAGISLPLYPNHVVEYGGSKEYGRRLCVYLALKGLRWRAEVVFVERLRFPFGLLGRHGVFSRLNEVAFLEKVAPPRVELRW
ncbi:MAG: hypothetical protein FJ291_25555 [Planctomycetes bacterium]|nr:hypothetical protein [Planctomycetota bacterium]